MNPFVAYFTFLSLMTSLKVQGPENDPSLIKKSSKLLMKEAKKEAKKLAQEEASELKKSLLDGSFSLSEQDFLPQEDPGKTFDAKEAKQQIQHAKHVESASSYAQAGEVRSMLEFSKKKEVIDEDFLVQSALIVQNPASDLDMASIENTLIPEEERLETCQEAGTYQVHFQQNLIVQASGGISQSIKHCKGHHASKAHGNTNRAKKHVSSKKESFKKDLSLRSFDVHRYHSNVFWSWTHQDNINSCNHFEREEKTLLDGTEEEVWEPDQAEALQSIESNPSCKFLYSTILKGPETRLINGKPVHRNVWSRQLFFSCEPDAQSKCAKLREQEAILVSKTCLQTNVLGKCDLWEKTYDLGKKGASQKTKVAFQKEELWGLQDEFATAYEKNTDFGPMLTTLSACSDMEQTLEQEGSDWQDRLQLFKGENLKCQKSFLEGNVFDCCKTMEGAAVTLKLARCKDEEKCLAKYRYEGKCHFVGSQKVKLGTVTEHVYCCFPSKLARIIHQQGRQQIGIKWGKAEKPKCRGLTLEELQKIDFSKIDLIEVIEDLKVDKQALKSKIEQNVQSLQAKVQERIVEEHLEVGLDPIQDKMIPSLVGKTGANCAGTACTISLRKKPSSFLETEK